MNREELSSTPTPETAQNNLYENSAAWDAVQEFERLRLDEETRKEWQRDFAQHPKVFFSSESQRTLQKMSVGKRIALLARASLHLTVTPSLAQQHFLNFPEDKAAVAALILDHEGMAADGITHTLFGLVWDLVRDNVHPENLRGHLRNGGQYDEIPARRERAPQALLSNHQEGGLRLRERFGDAAAEYVDAAKNAHELSISGDEPLDTSRVFSNEEYRALPEKKKAELLRVCLDDMQFSLVFEETFNSVFTQKNVVKWNAERKGYSINSRDASRYDPGHSMLFGTWQSHGTYDLQDEFFDREMSSTALTGGAIEEYAHHKLLLAVLREFQNVTEEEDTNTDLLVEFWEKNRNPIFANAVIGALKAQDSERAAPALLESLRNDTENRSAIVHVLRHVDGKTVLKNIVEITRLLEGEDTPERFFADSCALLQKQGALSFEDIEGGEFAIVSGSELRGQLRRAAQMEDIVHRTDASMYPKEFSTKLEQQFTGLRKDPNARFYSFEWQGQIASFMTFAERESKPHPVKGALREVYFGFFRTSEKFKGGKIGEALLEVALEREMERLTKDGRPFYVLAFCDPNAPITQKYLSLGFVPTRSFTTQEGIERLEIRLEPDTYYARRERSRS